MSIYNRSLHRLFWRLSLRHAVTLRPFTPEPSSSSSSSSSSAHSQRHAHRRCRCLHPLTPLHSVNTAVLLTHRRWGQTPARGQTHSFPQPPAPGQTLSFSQTHTARGQTHSFPQTHTATGQTLSFPQTYRARLLRQAWSVRGSPCSQICGPVPAKDPGGLTAVSVPCRHIGWLSAHQISALHEACRDGEYDRVVECIERGDNVEAYDETFEGSPLKVTCECGHTEIVSLLIEHGADIHANDENGTPYLSLACSKGHTDTARMLIAHGAEVNVKDRMKCTPLHEACLRGQSELVALLLQHQADVHAQSSYRGTPLFMACASGDVDTTRLLLEHGADVNAKDVIGSTPLYEACYKGWYEVATLLTAQQADIHAKNSDGSTALHNACQSENTLLVQHLLQLGADVHDRNQRGYTALHKAVMTSNSNIGTVQLLLDRGANVRVEGNLGETPLMKACQKGCYDTVSLLVQCGAELHTHDDSGNTALYYACQSGDLSVVEMLLKQGARVNATGAVTNTPENSLFPEPHYERADLRGQHPVKDSAGSPCSGGTRESQNGSEIPTHGKAAGKQEHSAAGKEENTALHAACRKGYADIAADLIKHGALVNAGNVHDATPLHFAAASSLGVFQRRSARTAPRPDWNATAKLLIHHGADINVQDDRGRLPLHYACRRRANEADFVALFLDPLTDVNAVQDQSDTALHTVCQCRGSKDTVALLLNRGAHANSQGSHKDTPLHSALRHGNTAAAKYLIEHKADVNMRNEDGSAPIHLACLYRHYTRGFMFSYKDYEFHTQNAKVELVNLLLHHSADVNAQDNRSNTALHYACRTRNLDLVKTLVKWDPCIETVGENDYTPLHYIITDSAPVRTLRVGDIMRHLLLHGADANSRDQSGDTMLHIAIQSGHSYFPFIEALLDHHADVNARNRDGQTPLHYACQRVDPDIVRQLLERGASGSIKDQQGNSPLDLAVKTSQEAGGKFSSSLLEVTDLLVNHSAPHAPHH